MSTAVSTPRWSNEEWRDWLSDVISYLNAVHGIIFMVETLPPTVVARFYRRHQIVMLRIEAEPEDKAQVLNDILTELGLAGLFGHPGSRRRAPLYLVPPASEEPVRKVWFQRIYFDAHGEPLRLPTSASAAPARTSSPA